MNPSNYCKTCPAQGYARCANRRAWAAAPWASLFGILITQKALGIKRNVVQHTTLPACTWAGLPRSRLLMLLFAVQSPGYKVQGARAT